MKDLTNSFPKQPEAKFSCPLTTYIPWFHNLIYKECPVCVGERDMEKCNRCPLKGEAKGNQNSNRSKDKKDIPTIIKREKGPIPNIGKTFSSE